MKEKIGFGETSHTVHQTMEGTGNTMYFLSMFNQLEITEQIGSHSCLNGNDQSVRRSYAASPTDQINLGLLCESVAHAVP